MIGPGKIAFGLDEETRDTTPAERLSAALPFQRNPALSRLAVPSAMADLEDEHTMAAGALDVTSHARLAARLMAAPHEAMDDLRTLGLVAPEARAHADVVISALIATDADAAQLWNEAFERELARHA